MRGKLTILILLLGSTIFTVYAYWYFFSTSPADSRFNLTRRAVPANSVLIAPQVGDYRLDGEPSVISGTKSGTYTDESGAQIKLSAAQVTDPVQAIGTLNAPINGCDKLTPHVEAKIPYVYAACPDNFTFAWINGSYRFEAQSSDLGLLVYFVNAYPY